MTWITNLCPNPSFEVDLTGYTALTGTSTTQSGQNSLYGQQSLMAITDGLHSGEGFYGPKSPYFLSPATACMSAYFFGESGTLTVSAVQNPGGTILATTTVQLTPEWTRVTLDGFSVATNDQIYLLVQTASAEVITFWVDGVQYEQATVSSPYIDGSFRNCRWLGTPNASSSVQDYQFPIAAAGGVYFEGLATLIIPGESFPLTIFSGSFTFSGNCALTVQSPIGILDDFAMYELSDLDPAMTFVGRNNAGVTTGQTNWNRNWGIFYPPLDYPVSDGSLLWKRAAYMAVGFEYANVPVGQSEHLTWVQVEQCPMTFDVNNVLDEDAGPSPYDTPRSVHTVVRPTRLNYCTNPSFETDLTGWSGSAVLSQDTTVSAPADYVGSKSMLMTLNNPGDDAEITLYQLITGHRYIISLWALPGPDVFNIQLQVARNTGSVASLLSPTGLPTDTWSQPYVIFDALSTTARLSVIPLAVPGATYPLQVWIDAVLIEEGDIVGSYFDGNYGNPDYLWENGGTPGLARSYYYENMPIGQDDVGDILDRHIQLGLTPAQPLYAQPPSSGKR